MRLNEKSLERYIKEKRIPAGDTNCTREGTDGTGEMASICKQTQSMVETINLLEGFVVGNSLAG